MRYMRLIAVTAGIVAGLVLAVVGGMSLVPYRYPAGVIAVIPDATCEPACVLGIQPGVTPAEDAIAILEAHPLISYLHPPIVVGDRVRVSWTWREAVPALATAGPSFLIYGSEGSVTAIHIKTNIDPATLRVTLDAPTTVHRVFADSRRSAHIIEAYPAIHTDVYHLFDCDTRQPSGVEFMVRGEQVTRYYSTIVTGYVQNRCRGG
jgi:hypothetical protein